MPIRGQVGSRLRFPYPKLSPTDDQLILRRNTTQVTTNGAYVDLTFETPQYDKFKLWDPTHPHWIKTPPGANWIKLHFIIYQSGGTAGAQIEFLWTLWSPSVATAQLIIGEPGEGPEGGRQHAFPWLPCTGGATIGILQTLRTTFAGGIAFAEASVRFAR